MAPPPAIGDAADYDDPVVPPPPAPEPRRGPAIIRRTPIGVPAVSARDESRLTPEHGVAISEFAEQTRIQHLGEIEVQRHASRPASKTAPPPIEEDEYEIEIDSSSSASMPASPGPVTAELSGEQAVRRTAHVVRRTENITRPPPTAYRSSSEDEVSMELDALTPPPAGGPAPEDDFSDVAAAVGANTDDSLDEAMPPARSRRPSTPSAPAFELDLDEARPAPALDDALYGLDDPDDLPVAQADDSFDHGGRPPALTDLYPRVKTPTSVPPIGGANPSHTLLGMASQAAPPQRLVSSLPVDIDATVEPEFQVDFDGAVRAWAEQVSPLASTALDEAAAQILLIYERELATLDESATSAALRIEAGRLCACPLRRCAARRSARDGCPARPAPARPRER